MSCRTKRARTKGSRNSKLMTRRTSSAASGSWASSRRGRCRPASSVWWVPPGAGNHHRSLPASFRRSRRDSSRAAIDGPRFRCVPGSTRWTSSVGCFRPDAPDPLETAIGGSTATDAFSWWSTSSRRRSRPVPRKKSVQRSSQRSAARPRSPERAVVLLAIRGDHYGHLRRVPSGGRAPDAQSCARRIDDERGAQAIDRAPRSAGRTPDGICAGRRARRGGRGRTRRSAAPVDRARRAVGDARERLDPDGGVRTHRRRAGSRIASGRGVVRRALGRRAGSRATSVPAAGRDRGRGGDQPTAGDPGRARPGKRRRRRGRDLEVHEGPAPDGRRRQRGGGTRSPPPRMAPVGLVAGSRRSGPAVAAARDAVGAAVAGGRS